jgi:hypothetical protein
MGGDMSTLRRLRNFWIPWVTTIILACFSDAVAQTSYKVTDLGSEGNDNLGCAMSVNNEGWTEIMAGNLPSGQQDNLFGQLLNGRALRTEQLDELGRDQRLRACGRHPRLLGNPRKPKHGQGDGRRRPYSPENHFAGEC